MGYVSINGRVAILDSEQELEDALNGATLPSDWNVLFKGSKFLWAGIDGTIISVEAQAVLDAMPQPLTNANETAIINFVNSQSASIGNGNWALMDAFAAFNLADDKNAGFDWIRETGYAVDASVVHSPGIGFVFNGTTAFIDSGFNPVVDGINYTVNDAQMGIFIVEDLMPSSGLFIPAGCADGVVNGQMAMFKNDNERSMLANSGSGTDTPIITGAFPANSLQTSLRNGPAATNIRYFEDGVQIATRQAPSDLFNVDDPLYIGARNFGNSPGFFAACTISSFIAGAAIGFDQVSYFNDLTILNAALAP